MIIAPNIIKLLKPEELIQIQVRMWFENKYPLHSREFHHFANERQCSKMRGYILKLMGVKAGVSDIFIDVPNKGYRGLWVELKAGNNKPTLEQKEFLARKVELGYAALCITGCDAAISFIETYMTN